MSTHCRLILRTMGAVLISVGLIGCQSMGRNVQTPHDEFFARVQTLCGKSFVGTVVADTPASADNPFANQRLIMHVRDCDKNEIRIPFHVGQDRSRTWIISKTAQGLRLKHDHRHQDGSSDSLTMYGGDSVNAGSNERQEFPADEESKQLFLREKRAVSVENIWAVEITDTQFVYELRRPNRHFRVEFDSSKTQSTPPPAWGYNNSVEK